MQKDWITEFSFTGIGYNKSGSGGYSHIWELCQNISSQIDATSEEQQGHASSKLCHNPTDVTAYPGNMELQSTPPGFARPHRDLLYESPKPTWREDDLYSTRIVGDILYYHEFDPSNANHVAEHTRKSEISQMRHGSTDCTLSLHDDWLMDGMVQWTWFDLS